MLFDLFCEADTLVGFAYFFFPSVFLSSDILALTAWVTTVSVQYLTLMTNTYGELYE